ncbi:MAG: hypothetical protein N2654_03100 [Deltaproteobacteria bacterium]|nr:hypothetical protein [Deltaproteobacteria bacterium]
MIGYIIVPRFDTAMKDTLMYLKEVLSEVGDDPVFRWLRKYFNYIFFGGLLIFLVYQGKLMYTHSQEAKKLRFADSLVTLQNTYLKLRDNANDEETKRQFFDLFSNFATAPEPYKTASVLYSVLYNELIGNRDQIKTLLIDHNRKTQSEFWSGLCPFVSDRFQVDLDCPQGMSLSGSKALREAFRKSSDEPIRVELEKNPYSGAILEETVFETVKKLLRE